MKRSERCSCGQFSIPLEGEPVLNALCNCNGCRRRTGSAFGWNTYWLEAQVGPMGGDAVARSVAALEPQVRHHCAGCGTVLSWTAGTAPGLVGIAAGTIEPQLGEPIATYADDQRCAWLDLPASWVRYP